MKKYDNHRVINKSKGNEIVISETRPYSLGRAKIISQLYFEQ